MYMLTRLYQPFSVWVRTSYILSFEAVHLRSIVAIVFIRYRIRQNIRGGKLSRFSRILAKRESFTIESFPSSQLENFIIIP